MLITSGLLCVASQSPVVSATVAAYTGRVHNNIGIDDAVCRCWLSVIVVGLVAVLHALGQKVKMRMIPTLAPIIVCCILQ